MEWFHKAAEQGVAAAQFFLGLMYADGRGVAKDERKAAEWFQRAANHGDATAQNNSEILQRTLPAAAAEPKQPLELFGVPLKGATRDQLRNAFKKGGLRPTREDDAYWVDIYSAEAVLDGASEFAAGYVMASGQFAFARYTFPASMDTELVGKVIDMVTAKYGPPSSQEGRYSLGHVEAVWNRSQGMQIKVSRGWPDTTTFLSFVDPAAEAQMQQEQNRNQQQRTREKAKAQDHAF